MTVNTGAYLQQQYNTIKALGDKVVSSDAMIVFEGFENIRLLCKQFPWPVLTSNGEIEIANPLGMISYQPQQIKIAQQGSIELYETQEGHIQAFLEQVIAGGGRFNASVYEGTVDKYKRMLPIYDCFMENENAQRDWENRSQIMTIGGNLYFHYFGEAEPGNS